MKMFDEVWHCGHCGTVDIDKSIVNACCDGCEELSYQCVHCKMLYSKEPKNKCIACEDFNRNCSRPDGCYSNKGKCLCNLGCDCNCHDN